MNKGSFQPGTMVRNKENGKTGVVIFDFFFCCGPNEVAVEWDGKMGVEGTDWKNLEVLGMIKPKVNFEKCSDCLFFTGQSCMRYTLGRAGMLYGNENRNKRIPNRIYPYCHSP